MSPTPGSMNENITAVTETNHTNSFHIYPNPTRDKFYVYSDQTFDTEQNIIVLNIYGQVIMEQPWKQNLTFDIGNLPSGLYMIAVKNNGAMYLTGKVIRQ
jgi:hypothetical protein